MKCCDSDNLSAYAKFWITFIHYVFWMQNGYTSMVLNPTAKNIKSYINATSVVRYFAVKND